MWGTCPPPPPSVPPPYNTLRNTPTPEGQPYRCAMPRPSSRLTAQLGGGPALLACPPSCCRYTHTVHDGDTVVVNTRFEWMPTLKEVEERLEPLLSALVATGGTGRAEECAPGKCACVGRGRVRGRA
jgi:hypothetical protein